jgi:hypothetical protein
MSYEKVFIISIFHENYDNRKQRDCVWQVHQPAQLLLSATNTCSALYYHTTKQHHYSLLVSKDISSTRQC